MFYKQVAAGRSVFGLAAVGHAGEASGRPVNRGGQFRDTFATLTCGRAGLVEWARETARACGRNDER